MDNNYSIESAIVNDAIFLSKLTKDSKSFWGYSQQQLEEWKDALKVTPEYITENTVFKILKDNQIIGYYSYIQKDNLTIQLDNIFISPSYIRKGVGKILMTDLFKKAMVLGYKKIILNSDPHAESFYNKMGFYVTGKVSTSIENRFLSTMETLL